MFNPLKPLIGVIATTLTITLLSFTHYQAFRLGSTIAENPLMRAWQTMTGASPSSCRSESDNRPAAPWLEEFTDRWNTPPGK